MAGSLVLSYLETDRQVLWLFLFFFSSRRRHTRYWRDWSSDVCSSDLPVSAIASSHTCDPLVLSLQSLWSIVSLLHLTNVAGLQVSAHNPSTPNLLFFLQSFNWPARVIPRFHTCIPLHPHPSNQHLCFLVSLTFALSLYTAPKIPCSHDAQTTKGTCTEPFPVYGLTTF